MIFEYRKTYLKEYRSENKERIASFRKSYYLNHKDAERQYQLDYRHRTGKSKAYYPRIPLTCEEKRERAIQRRTKYFSSDKGRICKKTDNLRRRIGTKGLSIKTIQMVYEDNIKKYGTLTCYLCCTPIEFRKDHLEHKIPISRGGTSLYENLAVACKCCNLKKWNKTEAEFKLKTVGNLPVERD